MAHSCASIYAPPAPSGRSTSRHRFVAEPAECSLDEACGFAGHAGRPSARWSPEYAVVYAETAAGLVLALRPPFAAASQRCALLPVTLIDRGETPFAAARRALLEQTGHESDCWQALGDLPTRAAPAGSRVHLFRVWRARETAEIWTDGLTVPTVITLSPAAVADEFSTRPRTWFDLATVLTLANPRPWCRVSA